LNSSVEEATVNNRIIVQRRRNHSRGASFTRQPAVQAVNEAVPNSYTRSDRPPTAICTISLRPNHIFTLGGVLDFGFRGMVRLRIISVPCGGLS